jgi:type IV pilus assembly protein PilB
MSLSLNSELVNKLTAAKLVNEHQLSELNSKLIKYETTPLALVCQGVISAENYLVFCQNEFNAPQFDISNLDLSLVYQQDENKHLILQYHAIPVSPDKQSLTLLTADPSDTSAKDDFEFNTGLPSSFAVCDPIALDQIIGRLYPEHRRDDSVPELDMDIEHVEVEGLGEGVTGYKTDAPIVLYVNKVLTDAIKQGASDIHFEPYETDYRVRFRIDGVLTEASRPPPDLSSRLAARIKVIANMDIAEKRLPQDGRLKLRLSLNNIIEFRVSSLPTIWGEKIVLRVLYSDATTIDLDQLGFEQEQKQVFVNALHQPQGLILVTGPTGSGKTLSLYTGLNLLNTDDKNISTAEDPVEIQLKGINQVQVNPKAGLNFSMALRAFLRQDPDVLMVGEVRDLETAEIAIKAAQTGHLVLSTLHTNSAAETIHRLMNMGVPLYNLVSSISLIMAQRLVRCLCPLCKEAEVVPPKQELLAQGFKAEQIPDLKLYKAVGCNNCNNGYKGRVGIFELIKPSFALQKCVLDSSDPVVMTEQLNKENSLLLRQAGLLKVIAGVTSLSELNRATKI